MREALVKEREIREVSSKLYNFETEMLDFGLAPDAKMQAAFDELKRTWCDIVDMWEMRAREAAP